jgi:hypothetical protein
MQEECQVADLDISNPTDFTDIRMGRGYTGASGITEQNNYDNISEMKTRLTAINATSYSAARLATMTKNDMIYALRRETADAAGIR